MSKEDLLRKENNLFLLQVEQRQSWQYCIQGFVKGEKLFSFCDLISSFSFIYLYLIWFDKKRFREKSHKMTGKIPLLLQILLWGGGRGGFWRVGGHHPVSPIISKNTIFQKFLHLENVIFKLFGGPGRSPSEKILPKMVPKGHSHLLLKIDFKMILQFFLVVEQPGPLK